jgi:uncharacterized protein with HEPN domain
MTQHDDLLYLGHMLDAAREAHAIAVEREKEQFDRDRIRQLALTHLIEIIGEAARKVSAGGRAAMPTVPWSDIMGMRHRIVHDYWNVNTDRVWYTAVEDLPPLIDALEQALPANPPE